MILLVTPSERASECAAALHAATNEEVVTADTLARTSSRLRGESYLAVVLDQYLLESEPNEAESVLRHMGTAIAVQVNFAICGVERVVREVRAALQWRRREETRAREAAIGTLQSELNGTVTALVLATELALETPAMPPGAMEKLKSVHELLKTFRKQLEGAAMKATAGK
jgi:hypothetical protein